MLYGAANVMLFVFLASALCGTMSFHDRAATVRETMSSPACNHSKVHDVKTCSAKEVAKDEEKKSAPTRHELSSVRLEETRSGVKLIIGAPGVEQKDLEVTQDENTLSVKGETECANEVYLVDRQIRLPSVIDLASAECTHTNGVLTITLKKKVAKSIPISVGIKVTSPSGAQVEAAERQPTSGETTDNDYEFE